MASVGARAVALATHQTEELGCEDVGAERGDEGAEGRVRRGAIGERGDGCARGGDDVAAEVRELVREETRALVAELDENGAVQRGRGRRVVRGRVRGRVRGGRVGGRLEGIVERGVVGGRRGRGGVRVGVRGGGEFERRGERAHAVDARAPIIVLWRDGSEGGGRGRGERVPSEGGAAAERFKHARGWTWARTEPRLERIQPGGGQDVHVTIA